MERVKSQVSQKQKENDYGTEEGTKGLHLSHLGADEEKENACQEKVTEPTEENTNLNADLATKWQQTAEQS